ncbi:MAG TPA: FAD-dependent monooxygenase [Symbiobacteriaceae bacterium]|nr:FAD-dependent monooxygenase [Symbiobacteriaceae bacterium]
MVRTRFGGSHAVVIGASMAGLLAARVLADHVDRVTLIEQEALPERPDARLGKPQSRNVSTLLARGAQVLEHLFPGLLEDLDRLGAVRLDQVDDVLAYQDGVFRERYRSGFHLRCLSRCLLEWRLLTRLARFANIRLMEQTRATRLLLSEDRRSIAGVRIARGGTEQVLAADLVVEASGCDSQVPYWLAELGFGQVPQSSLSLGLVCATCLFKAPEDADGWKALTLAASNPFARCGAILPLEGGRWSVSLWGYRGDEPPAEPEAWLDYARSLPTDALFDAVSEAEPLGSPVLFTCPGQLRRHYERMDRFPDGLLVLGDAACSFNPMYGQGTITAAMGAVELDRCLRDQPRGHVPGLARRFRQRLGRMLDVPWQLSLARMNGLSASGGPKRPTPLAVMNQYTDRMVRLAATDREMNDHLLEVLHMQKSPATLFAPGTVSKVLGGHR